MIVNMDVQVDLADWQKEFDEHQSQIGYAFAKAVNATALDAQKAIQDHIMKTFTVRRESYMKRSIKMVRFAKKNDPTAVIAVQGPGGTDSVFAKFEDGGTKTARSGGLLAIPTNVVQPDKNKV